VSVFFLFFILEMCQFCLWKKKAFSSFSPKLTKCWKFCLFSWNGSSHKLIYKKIGVYYSRWVLTSVGRVSQISLSITRISPGHLNLISSGHHHESDALTEIRTTSSLMCVRTGCENQVFIIKTWKFENRVGSDPLPGSGSQDLGAVEN